MSQKKQKELTYLGTKFIGKSRYNRKSLVVQRFKDADGLLHFYMGTTPPVDDDMAFVCKNGVPLICSFHVSGHSSYMGEPQVKISRVKVLSLVELTDEQLHDNVVDACKKAPGAPIGSSFDAFIADHLETVKKQIKVIAARNSRAA